MSSALWCVVNGRACAPPGIGWKIGVSTSMNPRSSSQRRVRLTIRLRVPERRAAVGVGPQVDVALAVAGVGVGDALPLVSEAPARLGQHRPRRDLHRELALLRGDHLAGGADPVAQADAQEAVEVLGHRSEGEQLHLVAASVAQRRERELALGPVEHHPPGDGDRLPGLLPRLQVAVRSAELGHRGGRLEPVGGSHGWFFS